MGYQDQDALANDAVFQSRVRACAIQQAEQTYIISAVPPEVSMAQAILRYEGAQMLSLFQISAQSPGLADKFAEGSSEAITDAEILSATQAYWNSVATSFYDETGAPRQTSVQLQP